MSQETPPPPAPAPASESKAGGQLDLPDLPPVPSDTPLGGNTPQVTFQNIPCPNIPTLFQDAGDDDDIDFDDLTKRFEALKKKK